MKIQEFAKHLDEPREIGKKKKRLSSSEMKKVKDKAFETYNEMLNYPNYIRNQAPVPANQEDGEHRYYNPDVNEMVNITPSHIELLKTTFDTVKFIEKII